MGVPVTKLGRYTLVRSLGAGGMAELFLARVDGIGGFAKLVALKRILANKSSNERFIRMLVNEARLVATLDHPNIAQVYDIGMENGEYFFAMEYVHGADLRRILHEAPEHRLQLENALHITIGVLAGLHHAHEATDPSGVAAEIVHRDVSPSNILVSYQGAVKLVDFGVAKAASFVSETREGVIKGKYGYMSPEQCLGQPLDRRSDLFAAGILLSEMTTGRRLYKVKGDLVTLQRVVYVDAAKPSRYVQNYPPELERIVMRALARDPAQRYATAEQMQLDLENFAVSHRMAVSAVSMSMEMRQLFRHRVDAWQQAQERGRSLADHLAEISSEEALPSSQDDSDGLGDVLDDLESSVATQLAPHAPPSRRSGVIVLLALFALAAAAVAVWAIAFRQAPTVEQVAAPASDAAIEIAADAATELAARPTIEIDATEAVAIETEQEEEPELDAGSKPATKHPKRKPAKPKIVAQTPADAAPPPVEPPRPDAALVVVTPPDTGPRPGTVDPADVRAVVRSHLSEIQECVGRARMDDRDLAGKITLRIELAATGKVTGTSVATSTGATPALEACMRKAVATWAFPAPSGNVRAAITYPFKF